jgi:hypothetical protein
VLYFASNILFYRVHVILILIKNITCFILDVQKPIQIKSHIFGSDRISFFYNNHPNQTEQHAIFILDLMTFYLETNPNRTANTLGIKKGLAKYDHTFNYEYLYLIRIKKN